MSMTPMGIVYKDLSTRLPRTQMEEGENWLLHVCLLTSEHRSMAWWGAPAGSGLLGCWGALKQLRVWFCLPSSPTYLPQCCSWFFIPRLLFLKTVFFFEPAQAGSKRSILPQLSECRVTDSATCLGVSTMITFWLHQRNAVRKQLKACCAHMVQTLGHVPWRMKISPMGLFLRIRCLTPPGHRGWDSTGQSVRQHWWGFWVLEDNRLLDSC